MFCFCFDFTSSNISERQHKESRNLCMSFKVSDFLPTVLGTMKLKCIVMQNSIMILEYGNYLVKITSTNNRTAFTAELSCDWLKFLFIDFFFYFLFKFCISLIFLGESVFILIFLIHIVSFKNQFLVVFSFLWIEIDIKLLQAFQFILSSDSSKYLGR